MLAITQFPTAGTPAWTRVVEQKIQQLETLVFQLQKELAQMRNQVGNHPVNPDVVLP